MLVLDGAYGVMSDDDLTFFDDEGSTIDKKRALEEQVPRQFERWLKRHGYLENIEAKEGDAWFMAGARELSGWFRNVEQVKAASSWNV